MYTKNNFKIWTEKIEKNEIGRLFYKVLFIFYLVYYYFIILFSFHEKILSEFLQNFRKYYAEKNKNFNFFLDTIEVGRDQQVERLV